MLSQAVTILVITKIGNGKNMPSAIQIYFLQGKQSFGRRFDLHVRMRKKFTHKYTYMARQNLNTQLQLIYTRFRSVQTCSKHLFHPFSAVISQHTTIGDAQDQEKFIFSH